MLYHFCFVLLFVAASNGQYDGYRRPISNLDNPNAISSDTPNYNDLPNDNLPPTLPTDDLDLTPSTNDGEQPPVEVPLDPNNDIPQPNEKDAICRIRFGYYRIDSKCDSYVECRNYRATERLCPDGMHFNRNARWPEYPCGYPMDVPCIGRGSVQPARPTAECPHQYGFYPLRDRSLSQIERCSRYMMCSEGKAVIMNCPFGLAFNEASGRCDWPELIPACREFLGFTCPAPPLGENEQPQDIVQNYRYGPNECYYFWSCELNRARLLSCDYGLAFDPASGRCVDEDLVQCNPDEPRPFEYDDDE